MTKLHIHCILKTEKEANARTVISRLNKIVSAELLELERYHKGGTSARLVKEMPEAPWATTVLQSLQLAQSFGRAWTITGSAEEEIDLCTSNVSISGIDWAQVRISRTTSREG